MNQQAEARLNEGILFEKDADFEKAKATYADILEHATDEQALEKIR